MSHPSSVSDGFEYFGFFPTDPKRILSFVLFLPLSEEHSDLLSTTWPTKEQLEQKLLERITDDEYRSFVSVMDRITEHPYSEKAVDFLFKNRIQLASKLNEFTPIPVETLEDGRKRVTALNVPRKNSRADVTVTYPGTGKILIGGKDVKYFRTFTARDQVLFPLMYTQMLGKVDVEATPIQGGQHGLAGCVRLGISRCLWSFVDDDTREKMRLAGLIQRDYRRRERKKPGQWGARRKFTWVKR